MGVLGLLISMCLLGTYGISIEVVKLPSLHSLLSPNYTFHGWQSHIVLRLRLTGPVESRGLGYESPELTDPSSDCDY
ncbi:uncharacterized protein B0J16DRAFT_334242 [Fusarium flagelliforme]|uniref:uncharacterized protein n=1 Tax=Fusarium flagelliforme TaxID=2675880 RepID=UPI001E8DB6A7|nr:uncharacterized protein B0J16DRAFT_334242 [Fusarium flagelliforme]KAH7193038.1 hypothetical protein B0J16DRAFT_334242 [Fusarium flagelliforme]